MNVKDQSISTDEVRLKRQRAALEQLRAPLNSMINEIRAKRIELERRIEMERCSRRTATLPTNPDEKGNRPDLYEILGIRRDADATTLRKKFYQLSLLLHSDRTASMEPMQRRIADAKYLEISNAYHILKDPE